MVSIVPSEIGRNFHMIHWKLINIVSIRFHYLLKSITNVSYQYDCKFYPQWLLVHQLAMEETSTQSTRSS